MLRNLFLFLLYFQFLPSWETRSFPVDFPPLYSRSRPWAWRGLVLVVHPGVSLTPTKMAAMVKGCRVLERVPFLVSSFENDIIKVNDYWQYVLHYYFSTKLTLIQFFFRQWQARNLSVSSARHAELAAKVRYRTFYMVLFLQLLHSCQTRSRLNCRVPERSYLEVVVWGYTQWKFTNAPSCTVVHDMQWAENQYKLKLNLMILF